MPTKLTDQQLLLSPDKWPLWPLLPLKRYSEPGRIEFGFVHADDVATQEFRVYIGRSIFALPSAPAFAEQVAGLKCETISGADALLTKWRID